MVSILNKLIDSNKANVIVGLLMLVVGIGWDFWLDDFILLMIVLVVAFEMCAKLQFGCGIFEKVIGCLVEMIY